MSSRRSRSGGSVDAHDVEAVVEILRGSVPRGASRLEVAVGRGDDAHVDRDRLRVPPSRWTLALLEHAQELRLQRASGMLADLVEEDRAAVRPARSCPRFASIAPVNAPRSWPNSSLSSSVSGMRRAVDARRTAARARGCARWISSRDQLLAGAGLAGDEDVAVGRGRAANGGTHAMRGSAHADETCAAFQLVFANHRPGRATLDGARNLPLGRFGDQHEVRIALMNSLDQFVRRRRLRDFPPQLEQGSTDVPMSPGGVEQHSSIGHGALARG